MKCSFVFLVLVCAVSQALSRSVPRPRSKKMVDNFVVDLITKSQQGRSCDDVQNYYQEIANCEADEQDIYNDPVTYTNRFCGNDCVYNINRAYDAIDDACGYNITDISEQYCARSDSSGSYCLEVWIEAILNQSVNDLFNACQQSYDPRTEECPRSCKVLMNYFNERLGCCYSYYYTDLGDDRISDDILEACGFKVPRPCPEPRKRFK